MSSWVGETNAVTTQEPESISATADITSSKTPWEINNLLTLDGGGTRGYWSLRALQYLMKVVGRVEQNHCRGYQVQEVHQHSFQPEVYPENVSQTLSEREMQALSSARNDQQKLRALDDTRRYLPCHYFDFIGGSSTGALIAIMLGRFRMNVDECLREYENLGAKVFGQPRHLTQLHIPFLHRHKFDAMKAEEVFKEVSRRRSEYQENEHRIEFRSDRGICRTFVTTLILEGEGPTKERIATTPHLIRTYDFHERRHSSLNPGRSHPQSRQNTTNTGGSVAQSQRRNIRRNTNHSKVEGYEVWEVARAATAAPFYFRPFVPPSNPRRCFIDGGFTHVNNPTTEGILDIGELFSKASIGTIVSVGTARKGQESGRGIKQKLRGMASLANDPQKVHNDVLAYSHDYSFEYFRLDDPNKLVVEMDEWEPKGSGKRTMQNMNSEFNAWIANVDVQEEFWRCAMLLVAHRRNRIAANRAKWERFATVAKYSCRSQQCNTSSMNRDECKAHLKSDHHCTDGTGLEDRVNIYREVWRYQGS